MLTPQEAAQVTNEERTQLAELERAIDATLKRYAGNRAEVTEEFKKAMPRVEAELLRRYQESGWVVERKQTHDCRGEPDGHLIYLNPVKSVEVPRAHFNPDAPDQCPICKTRPPHQRELGHG